MLRKFSREIAAAGLAARGVPGEVVTEADLAPLPPTAQRYLRFMGVMGRPRDTSFRLHIRGRFRPGTKQGWQDCEAWQYDSQPDVARLFHMRLRLFGLPFYGRDEYVNGRGRMLVRLLDLVTVQDARGAEYDQGELVTYLNDAILLAPTMLLVPAVEWKAIDDGSFGVSLTDGDTTVRARVLVDGRGAPYDFETTDRFVQDPLDRRRRLVRARWTTPVAGWRVVDGRSLPTGGRAVWHLRDGEFPYVEFAFEPDAIAFNVAPGA